mmetsp:Transcript_18235/g.32137  ORF Transcript_18235/g.32137 Transcript_18235/m.32137 type:complete len:91 (-) Transcript_18235:101-373(-)
MKIKLYRTDQKDTSRSETTYNMPPLTLWVTIRHKVNEFGGQAQGKLALILMAATGTDFPWFNESLAIISIANLPAFAFCIFYHTRKVSKA